MGFDIKLFSSTQHEPFDRNEYSLFTEGGFKAPIISLIWLPSNRVVPWLAIVVFQVWYCSFRSRVFTVLLSRVWLISPLVPIAITTFYLMLQAHIGVLMLRYPAFLWQNADKSTQAFTCTALFVLALKWPCQHDNTQIRGLHIISIRRNKLYFDYLARLISGLQWHGELIKLIEMPVRLVAIGKLGTNGHWLGVLIQSRLKSTGSCS